MNIYLILIFFQYIVITFQKESRKTINQEACIFPIIFNGKSYDDCLFSKEQQKEWCFIDHDMKKWGFCQPNKEKFNLFIFKSLMENNKDFLCLKSTHIKGVKRLQAVECDNVDQTYEEFLFMHSNFELRNLKNETIGNYFLDDQGRLLNIQTKKCLKISQNVTKLSDSTILEDLDQDSQQFELDEYNEYYEVSEQDCSISLKNNEIWQKEPYQDKYFKNLQLEKNIKIWKNGGKVLYNMLQKSSGLQSKLQSLEKEQSSLITQISQMIDRKSKLMKQKKSKQNKKISKNVNFNFYNNLAFFQNPQSVLNFYQSEIKIDSDFINKNRQLHLIAEKPFSTRFSTFIDVNQSGLFQFFANFSNGGLMLMVDNQIIINEKFQTGKQFFKLSKNLYFTNQSRIQLQGEYYCFEPIEPFMEIQWKIPQASGFEPILNTYSSHVSSSEEIFYNCNSITTETDKFCKNLYRNSDISEQGGSIKILDKSFLVNYTNLSSYQKQILSQYEDGSVLGYINEVQINRGQIGENSLYLQGYSTFKLDFDQYKVFYRRSGIMRGKNQQLITEINLSCQNGPQLNTKKSSLMEGSRIFQQIYLTDASNLDNQKLTQNLISQGFDRQSCFEKFENKTYELYTKSTYFSFNQQKEIPIMIISCDFTMQELIQFQIEQGNQQKQQLTVYCPSNCLMKASNKTQIFGSNIYYQNSSVCVSAIHAGFLQNTYGGSVKVTHLPLPKTQILKGSTRNQVQSKTFIDENESEKIFGFYFEQNYGKTLIAQEIKSIEQINAKKFGLSISFLQMDMKQQLIEGEMPKQESFIQNELLVKENNQNQNRESLGMIPSEVIGKMTSIMNQNTENIIKQNIKIKEVQQQNEFLTQKIQQIDSQDEQIKLKLQNLESQLKEFENIEEVYSAKEQEHDQILSQKMTQLVYQKDDELVQNNQQLVFYQKHFQVSQQFFKNQISKVIRTSLLKLFTKFNNILRPQKFQETYEFPLFKNWQIIDPSQLDSGPSNWQYGSLPIQNQSLITQKSSLSNYQDFKGKQYISLLVSRNKILNQDFEFKSDFYFKELGVFGFVLNYIDYSNFDVLSIEIQSQKVNIANKDLQIILKCIESQKQIYLDQKYFRKYFQSFMRYIRIQNDEMKDMKTLQGCSNDNTDQKCIQLSAKNWHQIMFLVFQKNIIVNFDNQNTMVITQPQYITTETNFGFFSQSGTNIFFNNVQTSLITLDQEARNLIFGKNNEKTNKDENEDILRQCLTNGGTETTCKRAFQSYQKIIDSNPNIEQSDLAGFIYKQCLSYQDSEPLACSAAYKAGIELYRKKID